MVKSELNLLKQSSLSRIYDKFKKYDIGTITAFRPKTEKTYSENMNDYRKLKQDLVFAGFSVTDIKGGWVDSKTGKKESELSLFVADYKNNGDLKDTLIKFGKKYNQDAVLFKAKDSQEIEMIGTNDSPWPGLDNVIKSKGDFKSKWGEYYSTIKGRPFVFESCSYPMDSDDINYYKAMGAALGYTVISELDCNNII